MDTLGGICVGIEIMFELVTSTLTGVVPIVSDVGELLARDGGTELHSKSLFLVASSDELGACV